MSKLIALTLLAAACATTSRSIPSELTSASAASPPRLELAATHAADDEVITTFPELLSERALPSADRHRSQLRAMADRFDLALEVCVAPDGSVADVALDRSSGAEVLDRAATEDIAQWKFAAYAAPSQVRVCKQLAIAYRPMIAAR